MTRSESGRSGAWRRHASEGCSLRPRWRPSARTLLPSLKRTRGLRGGSLISSNPCICRARSLSLHSGPHVPTHRHTFGVGGAGRAPLVSGWAGWTFHSCLWHGPRCDVLSCCRPGKNLRFTSCACRPRGRPLWRPPCSQTAP